VRRTTLARTAGALLAACLAVGVLAGCGSSGSKESGFTTTTTASPAAFADGLCSAVATYEAAVKKAAEPLTSGNVTKDSLTSAVDNVKEATSTFVADLKDLDAPDTAAGTQAKQAITSLSKALEEDLAAVEKALGTVSGVKDLPRAVTSIGTVAATAKIQVTSTVSDLQSLPKGELQHAFENSNSCQSASSSS